MWWSIKNNQPALTAEQLQVEINLRTQSNIQDFSVELLGRQLTVHGIVDSYDALQTVIATLLDLQIKHGLRVVLDVKCFSSRLPNNSGQESEATTVVPE